ncbi:unnamed protein product, partial [Gulo gulo]
TKAGAPGGLGASSLAPRGSDARGEGAGRLERLAEPRAGKNKAISFETKMKQTWPGKAKYLRADVNKGEKSSQGTLSFCAEPPAAPLAGYFMRTSFAPAFPQSPKENKSSAE